MQEKLEIALIQSPLYWENTEANLAMFEEKIWQLDRTCDLIILPEMFTTGFTMNPKDVSEPPHTKTYRWMRQQAAQTKACVMGSYVVRDGGQFFNRLYAIFPDGSSQFYDKRHLFALAGEDQEYQAGTQRLVVEVKGWRIMPMICYDLRFPVWSSSVVSESSLYEYDLLVYVANWPEPRVNAWDTLLQARAIENISYCAGVNRIGEDPNGAKYVGHSTVYDFSGKTICHSDEETLLYGTLSADQLNAFRKKFPFQKDADKFKIM